MKVTPRPRATRTIASNDGFVRPRFPDQVILSYFQASLLCEMIERVYGFDKILGMLQGYRQGQTTAEIFHYVLNSDLPALDQKFDAYVRDRYQTPRGAIRAQSLPGSGERRGSADWVQRARAEGKKVSQAHLRYLNPFPRNLGDVLKRYDRVLIPEINLGQLRLLIRGKYLVDAVGFNKVAGRPFTIRDVEARIAELV